MNKYVEMKRRHQEEFNKLNLGFAFSEKQFNEMCERWGIDPDNAAEFITGIGAGGFIQKKDINALNETCERIDAEMQAAINGDPTGDGFIKDMFITELYNHEYGYTGEVDDAITACGLDIETINNNKALTHGLLLATEHINNAT